MIRRIFTLFVAVFALSILAPFGASKLWGINPDASHGKNTVTGSVVTSDGKPAAGVVVKLIGKAKPRKLGDAGGAAKIGGGKLSVSSADNQPIEFDVKAATLDKTEAVKSQVTTDDSGNFKMLHIEDGTFIIMAGEGTVTVRKPITVPSESKDPLKITLDPK